MRCSVSRRNSALRPLMRYVVRAVAQKGVYIVRARMVAVNAPHAAQLASLAALRAPGRQRARCRTLRIGLQLRGVRHDRECVSSLHACVQEAIWRCAVRCVCALTSSRTFMRAAPVARAGGLPAAHEAAVMVPAAMMDFCFALLSGPPGARMYQLRTKPISPRPGPGLYVIAAQAAIQFAR